MTDAAVAKAITPTMIAEAICRLENAEPMIRGWAEGPVSLAHQNVVEALAFLRGTLERPAEGRES